ncbi:MAG: molybdenum cofactor biosynthesis protein MoaB [Actinophytocola sp.]|nr:molybdenum cofactor biosynthesis protein MoaB [Actinophytocola sp.]
MGERTARVIVASNRAAAGVYADKTGPVIAQWLAERSFAAEEPIVVPDGEPVADALRACVADGVQLVITTGGTGISPTDRTPEVTARVLDYEIPGLADAVRAAGLPAVPTSVLSRGVAGVAGATLVVNLPGSRGGVIDGLRVLDGVVEHALSQLAGGDHPRTENEAAPAPVRVVLAQVTEKPVVVAEHADLVADSAAGAVVTFGGVVRDHDGGRTVRSLFYEGHPTASDVLDAVVAEVTARHAGVRAIAVSHRVGALEIGDVALACAVAAAHRQEAFAACGDLVDTAKHRLPIWKHQVFADGTDEWVNSP